MILKRCNNGHYYDGEIYKECPECMGAGRQPFMQAPAPSYGDYADEDSVTVALPRTPSGRRPAGAGAFDDDPATAALAGGLSGRRPAGGGIFDDDPVTAAMPHTPPGRKPAGAGIFDDGPVTAAMPRTPPGQKSAGAGVFDDSPATAAMPQKPQKPVRKQGLKPVVGWLLCIQGMDIGNSFTVRLGKNFIGRSSEMEIALHGDEGIAMEKHAAVYYVPKQRRFAVEPGLSGRPFYVNRNAVTRPIWIKQHDIITLGNASLMFFPCCGEHFSWEELIRRRKQNQGR